MHKEKKISNYGKQNVHTQHRTAATSAAAQRNQELYGNTLIIIVVTQSVLLLFNDFDDC